VRTVETHRAHVQQKLGLAGRPELTRYALAHGLIDALSA
jgi:two-component system response regulator NreC